MQLPMETCSPQPLTPPSPFSRHPLTLLPTTHSVVRLPVSRPRLCSSPFHLFTLALRHLK